jgi:hypothetical protein
MKPAQDPVPPAAALRLLVANLTSNPLRKMTSGGPALVATLATLLEWVDETERRLALIETACGGHAVELRALPRQFEERLQHVLAMADRLGQAPEPISDQARPGGPSSGDRPWTDIA